MVDRIPEEQKKARHAVPKWYAVYTKARAEKQVNERLVELGIETFLPLQKTYRQWTDRKKLIEKPLLSSYVFVKTVSGHFPAVYNTPGVVRFVRFEGKPVAIPQCQIDVLRLLVDSDAKIDVTSEVLAKGDNVKVMCGSLTGLTGELISVKGKKRVVVRLDKLEQNIVIKVPVTFLKKV